MPFLLFPKQTIPALYFKSHVELSTQVQEFFNSRHPPTQRKIEQSLHFK